MHHDISMTNYKHVVDRLSASASRSHRVRRCEYAAMFTTSVFLICNLCVVCIFHDLMSAVFVYTEKLLQINVGVER